MRTPTRALRPVGLLVGFYLLTGGVLAALLILDVVLVLHIGGSTPLFAEGKVIGCTVIIALPLVRGLAMSVRRLNKRTAGVPVTRQEQPRLWERVCELAEQAGTRPPAEIVLGPAVQAAVREDARLMGLLPGRRWMYLGVPLLLGLTAPQLDAVLAHELGHYCNRDVRLAPTIVRGRMGVLAVARACRGGGTFPHRLMRSFFTWYADLYMRSSQAVSRQQELAADTISARIAGRDNAAAALRRLPALDAAYDFYLSRYVSIGWEAGLRPLDEEFFGGLNALLAEPARRQELAALLREPPRENATPYDSHPPLAARIAALEALPADGRTPTGAEPPALTLLRHTAGVCARVAATALPPEGAGKRPVDWLELARGAGRAALARDAERLLRTAAAAVGTPVPDLPALLQAVEAGWLDPIAGALPRSEHAREATGRAAREFARTALREAVTSLVLLALVDAGRAHWTHSWARTLHLEFDDGWEDAATAAVTALVADPPDTGLLRGLLHGLGAGSAPVPSAVPGVPGAGTVAFPGAPGIPGMPAAPPVPAPPTSSTAPTGS